MDINAIIDWIERHEHTVDLLKWIAAGLLVWFSGAIKFIRDLVKKPKLEVDLRFSSWYCEPVDLAGQGKNEYPVVVLADIRVLNPTRERIGVSGFDISVRRPSLLSRWYRPVRNIGFPARPTIPLSGTSAKVLRVWFDRFPDGPESTARTVEPQHAESAHAMFSMSFSSHGFCRADRGLEVKVRAYLGSGEICTAKAIIGKRRRFASLDRIIENGTHFALIAARHRRAE